MYDAIKVAGLFILLLILSGCGDDVSVPKPSAQLALNYPDADYVSLKKNIPYTFLVNDNAVAYTGRDSSLNIQYSNLDAKIYLTYRTVENNLRELLIDGQKLSYNHNQMADAIAEYPFVNKKDQVYGMQYEIEGNAASNVQFYATDSTQHFLTASLYFNREPNYDSILPAIDYVRKDMIKMMESLKWKN